MKDEGRSAGAMLGPAYVVPSEDRLPPGETDGTAYERLLAKLSRQSVVKHFEAYTDIDWDSPEMRIDPADPRWALDPVDALAQTAWYRGQPVAVQAAIGLHMGATFAKIGLQFESILKRGLLEFAQTLPNGSPEFRYVYHEIIEEAQHALMFQEFVNRSGFDIPGLPPAIQVAARRISRLGSRFPELFFIFVLGGEDPIDHLQRGALAHRNDMHPLLRRISQIHITEEARHLSFARQYLRRHVPRLDRRRMRRLRRRAPLILSQMAQRMMQPSEQVIAQHGIPPEVVAEAYTRNPSHQARTLAATAKVRALCEEVGILTPRDVRRWRRLGLYPAEGSG